MNIRIKYTKTGPLRFISHLDMMRYFQKAINRAGLDISYSTGLSPHQIISFAAPMPLMMTSEGEYLDASFNSVTTSKEMIESFNRVASPYAVIKDMVILPDKAVNSMAAVSASDYRITFKSDSDNALSEEDKSRILSSAEKLFDNETITVIKKTKKSEALVDIKPLIFKLIVEDNSIYMLLATGSRDNLKPELVMEAIMKDAGLEYNRFSYDLHRLETYMDDGNGGYTPLICAGSAF